MNFNRKTGWCNSPDHVNPGASRREFLYVGMIGGLGLTLGDYLGMKSNAAMGASTGATVDKFEDPKATADSVIHIFLPGGMAHQESWDPKPLAPVEYRGPMGQVKTSIPGEYFGETMQATAKIANKIAVCRGMTHGEAAHERGTHNMFTGYRPSPAIKYPSIGSVVSQQLGVRKNNMPPYTCIPSQPNEDAGSGYMSSAYGPFSLGADPSTTGFKVRDLQLASGVDDARFGRRRDILSAVDSHFRRMEKSDALDAMGSFYQSAYGLISSPEARAAFDLDKEADALKEEYGRNTAGMRMLMARRLVESGVRFVSMTYGGWDMHAGIKNGFERQMPQFDKAYAALITDLDRKGMLDRTLVVVSSEFGRTPKVNKDAGRDHYPKVFSIAMAGGGIKKGYIHGSSDAIAAEPNEKPLTVEDMAHTIYHCLGINASKRLMAPGDRPIDIVRGGHVVKDLMA
ncbi:DUF1501 domain-containing protein [Humisphaera borealis]|uniref:DUF1501 domain-containing protein n=1 Tax=Humisphaera borealis TaxID=2807512 RepID=A0A7M2WRP0_9BACT|nr:DUF1501 domain-containing protein [Humisphaera borealis]QOV88059.1 DUF1501 domain-containing protein [Humisphaera borealis]